MEKLNATQLAERLPLMEQFYTVQGEGAHQGKAAYFIRLGGCDVGCVWCDVKESWDADQHPPTSIGEMVSTAAQHRGRIVVITGGEPLMYDLTNLTAALKAEGFRTHIETSGRASAYRKLGLDLLIAQKFKAPLPHVIPVAHELKIIIYNKHDFKWAETYAAEVSKDCQLFLQPEWDRTEQMMPLIVEYVKANPQWQISLQTHKFMNIP